MYSNYILGDLISSINLGYKRRLRFIKINLNDTFLDILNILYKQGVIRAFLVKNNKILIYYKYYLSKIIVKLTLISKPGNRIYWSLNKLSNKYNNNNFSGFYIISTQKGLMVSENCLLKKHISGEILIKVEI